MKLLVACSMIIILVAVVIAQYTKLKSLKRQIKQVQKEIDDAFKEFLKW